MHVDAMSSCIKLNRSEVSRWFNKCISTRHFKFSEAVMRLSARGGRSFINESKAMKEQAHNHVNPRANESDGATVEPTSAASDEFVTETFEYDGGRQVTVYVPPNPPEAIVFAGDGQRISKWGRLLAKAEVPSTMIVGVHRLADEMQRLLEYSSGFAPERFAANEKFFVDDVLRWTQTRFDLALPSERTAVFGIPMSSVQSSAPRPAAVISRRALWQIRFRAHTSWQAHRSRFSSRTQRGGRTPCATQVRTSS